MAYVNDMALSHYPSSSKRSSGRTEFEILKESHKFLREDTDGKDSSWNDQLAGKYYASLYREFAVCDLKHYKSGNFALRWRSEDEVLSGAGESTCGNIRCDYHNLPEHLQTRGPTLSTLELPFAYEEQGESKSALVKVVLCPKCLKKLMWKRRKDKDRSQTESGEATPRENDASEEQTRQVEDRKRRKGSRDGGEQADNDSRRESQNQERRSRSHRDERERRTCTSRSRSPRDKRRTGDSRRDVLARH